MASYKDNYGKYYCKYCDLTLARNAASIAQHEQGNRHKRNVARFLRTVGRGSAEDRETARELRRIEAATGLHFSTPKARPPPSASLNPTPPPPPSSVTLVPPAEPAPVSTYDDNEDEESLVRRGVAAPMPGEWTVVEPVQPPSPGTEEGNHEDEGNDGENGLGKKEGEDESNGPPAKVARCEWRGTWDANKSSGIDTGLRIIRNGEDVGGDGDAAAEEGTEAALPPVAASSFLDDGSDSEGGAEESEGCDDVMALFKPKGRAAGRCTRRIRAARSDSEDENDD